MSRDELVSALAQAMHKRYCNNRACAAESYEIHRSDADAVLPLIDAYVQAARLAEHYLRCAPGCRRWPCFRARELGAARAVAIKEG